MNKQYQYTQRATPGNNRRVQLTNDIVMQKYMNALPKHLFQSPLPERAQSLSPDVKMPSPNQSDQSKHVPSFISPEVAEAKSNAFSRRQSEGNSSKNIPSAKANIFHRSFEGYSQQHAPSKNSNPYYPNYGDSAVTQKAYSFQRSRPTEAYNCQAKVGSMIMSQKSSPVRPTDKSYQAKYNQGVKGLVGLVNLGNTWFMNWILQALAKSPIISTHWIFSIGENINHKRKSGGELAQSFWWLLKNLESGQSQSEINPQNIKQQIGHLFPQFDDNSQQDCMELLRWFLEGIHQDLNRVTRKPPYQELPDTGNPIQVVNQWWEYNRARDDSIVTDLFRGQILSIVSCLKWQVDVFSADVFLDLPLFIEQRNRSTIQEWFRSFVKSEWINDYTCRKCKKKTQVLKRMQIVKFPKILLIQLKRFEQHGKNRDKLNTLVVWGERLDLAEYSASQNPRDAVYRLYAVVHHIGDLGFGHYTAECKIGTRWYVFDDEKVSMTDAPSINRPSVYVLFYKQESLT